MWRAREQERELSKDRQGGHGSDTETSNLESMQHELPTTTRSAHADSKSGSEGEAAADQFSLAAFLATKTKRGSLPLAGPT